MFDAAAGRRGGGRQKIERLGCPGRWIVHQTYSAAAEAGGRRHGYREDEIKADGRVRGTAAVVQDIACGPDGVRLIARNGPVDVSAAPFQIGRASCRERVCQYV